MSFVYFLLCTYSERAETKMATTQNVQSFTYEKAVEWLFDNKVDVNMWENLETLEELTRLINSLISNRENGQRRLGETGHLDTELMPKVSQDGEGSYTTIPYSIVMLRQARIQIFFSGGVPPKTHSSYYTIL